MLRPLRTLGITLLCAAAAGCGGDGRTGAAKGATRFLAAVKAGDRMAFEEAIDRPVVREDLRRRLMALAHASGLDVEGGPSDLTLDRMISPGVFHLTQAANGQPLAQAPTVAQVASMMRLADRDHACLVVQGACLLGFTHSSQGWRLTAMPPPEITVPVGPAPGA